MKIHDKLFVLIVFMAVTIELFVHRFSVDTISMVVKKRDWSLFNFIWDHLYGAYSFI